MMGKLFIILSLIINTSLLSYTQTPTKEDLQQREEKYEDILRIQDTRTPHNGKLLQYLSDHNPYIRQQATEAFGTIQDTSVLNLLLENLSDNDENIQYAAVYAIGQTATQLSKENRETLQHDLIWVRYDKLAIKNQYAANRLIEDIGKFGTAVALKDLVMRFGTEQHTPNVSLIMSIARFAIRNIVVKEATEYLIGLAHNPEAPWQVLYAMQRIGKSPELVTNVMSIAPLYQHPDPLARMYLATLLCKLKDSQSSLEPLMKLAELDSDWRVRINAIRALGNFSLKNDNNAIDLLKRLFLDKVEYIGLVAIETAGNTDIKVQGGAPASKDLFALLRRMAENKDEGFLVYYQVAAAQALAKLTGKDAESYITVNDNQNRLLLSGFLRALGQTKDPKVVPTLESFFNNSEPTVVMEALGGLEAICEAHPKDSASISQTYSNCMQLLTGNDVAILSTVAEILGDSIFLNFASVQPLCDKFSHLRIPYDIEAMQAICETLGKLGDKHAVAVLEEALNTPDRSVAQAAANALEDITGKNYQQKIPDWFQPLLTDFDFDYLHKLPDTVQVTMETTRGDVAMELYKKIAPFTVMSFLKLASEKGYFRGLTFHRIIPNFVIQGGDPRGDGWGGPGYELRSEFSSLSYETGSIGMANAGKDTEGSQFFITESPQPHLDGKYTLFGHVTSGMDVVNVMRVDDRILDIKIGK